MSALNSPLRQNLRQLADNLLNLLHLLHHQLVLIDITNLKLPNNLQINLLKRVQRPGEALTKHGRI